MALSSRFSPSTGHDLISINLLTNISNNGLMILLEIPNSLWLNNIVPDIWTHFHVIPIPKLNTSPTDYRPIALSLVICKLIDYMIKNRLDWYLEKNNFIAANQFGFRRGLGTMECLSSFIGHIYQTFCNKKHLVAAFIDIKGANISIYLFISLPLFLDFIRYLLHTCYATTFLLFSLVVSSLFL